MSGFHLQYVQCRSCGMVFSNRFLECTTAKTVKMQDIAQKLGVSTMTVSKALTGKSGVSEQTRQRIKTIIIRTAWQPFTGSSIRRSVPMRFCRTVL